MQKRESLNRSARIPEPLASANRLRVPLCSTPSRSPPNSGHDEVVLGHTGIRASQPATGTGTTYFGGSSNHVRMGKALLLNMPPNGRHENGLR